MEPQNGSSGSRLEPHLDSILAWQQEGKSYRDILDLLKERCEVTVSYTALRSFVQRRTPQVETDEESVSGNTPTLESIASELAELNETLNQFSRAVAESFSESLRQQIGASGLQTTAETLKKSSADISALSVQLSASLKPLTQQLTGSTETLKKAAGEIGALSGQVSGQLLASLQPLTQQFSGSIDVEMRKIASGADSLRQHSRALIDRSNTDSWWVTALLATVLCAVSFLAGLWWEKGRTTDGIRDIEAQLQRLQTPPAPVIPTPVKREKQKGSKGAVGKKNEAANKIADP